MSHTCHDVAYLIRRGCYHSQAWHSILVVKIQELQANHRENTGGNKGYFKENFNFHSSQSTGENCHFTGNTGITGGRARPAFYIMMTYLFFTLQAQHFSNFTVRTSVIFHCTLKKTSLRL